MRLGEGERISSIEVEAAGSRITSVHIPTDWNFEVNGPVSDVAELNGEAAHGIGMPSTTNDFQRFLTLAFYDDGVKHRPFSITVKFGLFLYDRNKKRESTRTIEVPPKDIVLEETNRPVVLTP